MLVTATALLSRRCGKQRRGGPPHPLAERFRAETAFRLVGKELHFRLRLGQGTGRMAEFGVNRKKRDGVQKGPPQWCEGPKNVTVRQLGRSETSNFAPNT